MVPSKIKIESFAKRYHMGTLGGKGLIQQRRLALIEPFGALGTSLLSRELFRGNFRKAANLGSRRFGQAMPHLFESLLLLLPPIRLI